MPTLAYPVASLIERLDAIASIKLVGLAPDLAAALATPPRNDPAVFVLSESRGGAIKYSGPPIQQNRTTAIKLVTWVRNHGGAQKAREEMDAVLGDIDARMAGYTPGDAFGSAQFKASRDEFAHAQYLVTQTIYESDWNFSANHQP